MKKRSRSGFTIVELAVVITVIGILAAMTTMAYGAVQSKARGASLVTTVQKVETALRLSFSKQNYEIWPRDTVLTGLNNPRLDLIASPSFVPDPARPEAAALQQALGGEITTSGMKGLQWTYDNDGDVRLSTTCDNGAQWTGVVLAVTPIKVNEAKEVDSQIDDGNLGCGKIRHSGSTLLYQLGFDQEIK